MSILSIQNITKKFSNHLAVDDVSFEVPAQSIFGLLGPNGAGKTTLLRIINKIIAPDNGNVLLNDYSLLEYDLNNIGYLPEERGLYRKMEVGAVTLYLAQLRGLKKDEALEKIKFWFNKFEIQGWWNKKIEELSKGMQQKIQFIITVLHEPKLLILDEPFTGFDPINTNIIKNEILRLKEEGATILLSTHRMESVEELCDNIALINKAKKILDGSVKEIKDKYKTNTYDVEFTGKMPDLTDHKSKFEVVQSENGADLSTLRIKTVNNLSSNDLLQILIPHIQINSFTELIPSMNDIFIKNVQQETDTINTIENSN